jgi:hypothetical protein
VSEEKVSLVRCQVCEAPVVLEVGRCNSCNGKLDGSEVRYIEYFASDDTVARSIKRLIFISVLVLLFSGFAPGIMAYGILGVTSVYYAIKIIKAI